MKKIVGARCCVKCTVEKSSDDFYKSDPLCCIECHKKRNQQRYLKNKRTTLDHRRFSRSKWTVEAFEAAWIAQDGKCAICIKPMSKAKTGSNRACADHDHMTNKPRSILCHSCNLMIGMAKDNAETLLAAAEYLRCHHV